MPAFNQVILVGNLTTDIQVSFTPSQTAVADAGMAVNEKWTAGDGTKRESTLFVDVKAFGKLADLLRKYCRKGSCVMVVGSMRLDRWEKDGHKHSKHWIAVESVQFLTPQGSRVEASGDNPDRY